MNDGRDPRRRYAGRRARRILFSLTTVAIVVGVPSGAWAHPLGNFSVNHLDQLTFRVDEIVNDAIVDTAEIPTQQEYGDVDADGDGLVTEAERQMYALDRCGALADQSTLTVDDEPALWAITDTSFEYSPGQAGLETSRLECRLVAVADLSTRRTVKFVDDYEADRVGWAEINAVGDGVQIVDSPVPQSSVTDGLRSYPDDLLESPLDVRQAVFTVEPGDSTASEAVPSDAQTARDDLARSTSSFLPGLLDDVQERFDDMIGQRQLTFGVGLLAIALALVLGASHALLPGHGKTVMAAYIAGRQGSVRDAVTVGATVTATHTGGVLLLGLALTLSTALAGETVIGWLGVSSGALVAVLGAALLVGAVRHRGDGLFGHGHSHAFGQEHHSHDDPDSNIHDGQRRHFRNGHNDHDHEHGHPDHDHDHAHGHDDHDHEHSGHHDHDHHHHDHDHRNELPGADPHTPHRVISRQGLIGMGIAGGLVPSPSALIILLSAIALGRTWFGILLVVGYGVGMAATLTMAGVLLVKVRDRYQNRATRSTGRARRLGARWTATMPYATASLVLVVGVGLAVRSLANI